MQSGEAVGLVAIGLDGQPFRVAAQVEVAALRQDRELRRRAVPIGPGAPVRLDHGDDGAGVLAPRVRPIDPGPRSGLPAQTVDDNVRGLEKLAESHTLRGRRKV